MSHISIFHYGSWNCPNLDLSISVHWPYKQLWLIGTGIIAVGAKNSRCIPLRLRGFWMGLRGSNYGMWVTFPSTLSDPLYPLNRLKTKRKLLKK